ncbi:MAG: hypothetical protein QNJ47_10000 [Nostocaceae cyanobacterium]|nr:hypothetical protein [Nostocaceae cyanobacterium]
MTRILYVGFITLPILLLQAGASLAVNYKTYQLYPSFSDSGNMDLGNNNQDNFWNGQISARDQKPKECLRQKDANICRY